MVRLTSSRLAKVSSKSTANPSRLHNPKSFASRYVFPSPFSPSPYPRTKTPRQVYEPLLIVGLDKFANVDIRVRVSGGGHTSQIYAIRQAIAKSIVAYYQKYVDEYAKNQLKQALVQYDRTLLVADNRRCEPKVCDFYYYGPCPPRTLPSRNIHTQSAPRELALGTR